MSTIVVITFAGIALIGVLGFIGRRRPAADLAEWTVGGRRFGATAMWFLQAGEIFTTFTFLGMAGLAFGGGVASLYVLLYAPLACLVTFFLARPLWTLGKERGYLTQGDFLEDRYGSKLLGALAAVLGVLFVLPYLQLQITGLGLIVKLVTGDTASSTWSMVTGSALVVLFVLWAGLRGVATTSYFKDAIMVVVLVALIIVVPAHFAGGIGTMFHRVSELRPELLTLHSGPNDRTWFFTGMLVSALGLGFLTLPHSWPAVLSAKDPVALRRNYSWLPVYALCLLLPAIVGFTAVLALPRKSDTNGVLLTTAAQALPSWATGLVVVAAIATAMVPSAGILIGLSSLVSRNLVRAGGERARIWVNHGTVVTACALALLLGLFRPDLLANLLLLTFSGTVQLAPAIALGLPRRRLVTRIPVLCGLLAGEGAVVWLTFVTPALLGHFNPGIAGLLVNGFVLALAEAVRRLSPIPPVQRKSTETPTAVDPERSGAVA